MVRTTRRLSLTEAGESLNRVSRQFLSEAEEALADITGESTLLRGTLRVDAPIDYGALVVAPALVALRRAHPQLKLELLAHDHVVDLIAQRIDVAIRLGRLTDSSYRAHRLGEFERWLVASPEWIERFGEPRHPRALAALPFVGLSLLPNARTLHLRTAKGARHNVRCEDVLFTNTATGCRAATLAGGGFGFLTDFSIAEDVQSGRLVRLLPRWTSAPTPIHAVYPPTHYPQAKVRALIDALHHTVALTIRSRAGASQV